MLRVEEFEVRQLASPGIAVQTPAPEQFWVEEAGPRQRFALWNAVIELVQETGEIRAARLHDYLKSAVLVERTSATTLRLAVSHEVTRQPPDRTEMAPHSTRGGAGPTPGRRELGTLDIEVISTIFRNDQRDFFFRLPTLRNAAERE